MARYELRLWNSVPEWEAETESVIIEENEDIECLVRMARIADKPYRIYEIIESKFPQLAPERMVVVRNKKKGGKKVKLTDSDILNIRERYSRGGTSLRKLAAEYHVSMSTIDSALHKEFVPKDLIIPYKRRRRGYADSRLTKEEIEGMVRMVERGYQTSVVAKRYSIGVGNVVRIVKNNCV